MSSPGVCFGGFIRQNAQLTIVSTAPFYDDMDVAFTWFSKYILNSQLLAMSLLLKIKLGIVLAASSNVDADIIRATSSSSSLPP